MMSMEYWVSGSPAIDPERCHILLFKELFGLERELLTVNSPD